MTKERKAKIGALLVFFGVFIWGLHSSPNLVKWHDLLNPTSSRCDIAFLELIGASLIPLFAASIWYLIWRPKPPKREKP